jgi:hypothetical protein
LENYKTNKFAVKLTDDSTIYIESASSSGIQDVANSRFSFDGIEETIKTISSRLHKAISGINPSKASVEFGLEFSVESGKITSMIVKGEGKGNLKITLEWEKKKENE